MFHWQLCFFLWVHSRTLCAQWTCHILRTRLSLCLRFPCHALVYSCTPFCHAHFLLLVPLWIVDSSPVTCLFSFSPFVLSTRTLTLHAYVFLLLTHRLVCAYRYHLRVSFCSLSTRLSPLCICILHTAIYTGWRCGLAPHLQSTLQPP